MNTKLKKVLVLGSGALKIGQALQQIKDYLPECNVIGVPNAMEAVSKGSALNGISWNIKVQNDNQKFVDDYHKLAQKVVKEQQKQPFSFEEALRQTAIINGLYDGDK